MALMTLLAGKSAQARRQLSAAIVGITLFHIAPSLRAETKPGLGKNTWRHSQTSQKSKFYSKKRQQARPLLCVIHRWAHK